MTICTTTHAQTAVKGDLDEETYKRGRHVFGEIARTTKFADDLKAGKYQRLLADQARGFFICGVERIVSHCVSERVSARFSLRMVWNPVAGLLACFWCTRGAKGVFRTTHTLAFRPRHHVRSAGAHSTDTDTPAQWYMQIRRHPHFVAHVSTVSHISLTTITILFCYLLYRQPCRRRQAHARVSQLSFRGFRCLDPGD